MKGLRRREEALRGGVLDQIPRETAGRPEAVVIKIDRRLDAGVGGLAQILMERRGYRFLRWDGPERMYFLNANGLGSWDASLNGFSGRFSVETDLTAPATTNVMDELWLYLDTRAIRVGTPPTSLDPAGFVGHFAQVAADGSGIIGLVNQKRFNGFEGPVAFTSRLRAGESQPAAWISTVCEALDIPAVSVPTGVQT